MRHLIFVAAAAIALTTFALAQQTTLPHVSREEALAFLQEKHIYLQGMDVVSSSWDEKKRVWIIVLSFHGASIDTWTVDGDAKKFWFINHRLGGRAPLPSPNLSAVRADDVDDLRKKYLSDPTTSAEMKHAIEQRIVIAGMCPFQAFAAAGEPGFYKVVADKKWPSNIAPPVIINAQCDDPDDSVIELTFRSSTQFHTKEPVPFTVKFEHGRAVSIEQPLPPTIARPPNHADAPNRFTAYSLPDL